MSHEAELGEILDEFLVESREHLAQFELALLALESDPSQSEALQALFRSVHSIKGSCGFFNLTKTEAVTHSAESLLDRLRDGRMALTPEITSVILVMVDVVRRLLTNVELEGGEGDVDVSALVGRLDELAEGRATQATPGVSADATSVAQSLEELRALSMRDTKIRVDTQLLERLMNLAGELVLSRNQVLQHATATQDPILLATAQRLSVVSSEIQEVVMKTRMQPIGRVWSRLPRLVRDLARSCGKQVRIELLGKETELDKSLIEAIQDPLTHLVRNAIDHGIESAELRTQRGKPLEGRISLRAYHEAGMVNIEITDDGAGIDPEAVRKRAVAHGVLTPDLASRMSDREVRNVIFMPGFSTQETVTNLSGRGVGMDVVKTNVEKIGGTVDLSSELGRGTTVKIKIPLTLAIVPALIVTSGGERYAIPQANLLEVVRFDSSEAEQRIELIQRTPVLRLRGKLLPLAYLHHELGQRGPSAPSDLISIVVLQANDRSFGLVVDAINDTEEIVVKPLWKRLKGLSCYAGATVMGDGRVALILEPLGLAQRLGVLAQDDARKLREVRADNDAGDARHLDQVLLCRLGGDGRVAIPLSKVARLEDLPLERIERTGPAEVIQYRERILPLLRVASLLEERRKRPRHTREAVPSSDSLSVVVYAHEGRSFGLVVDKILDVVEVELALERSGARRGTIGSMVVQGRVTEFLDVEALIGAVEPTALDRSVGA